MYGYLLVTKSSLPSVAYIAADYHSSVVKMLEQNNSKKTNYSCCVICLNCSLWFRLKLSYKTGIPFGKIHNVENVECVNDIISADSLVDDTFCGKVKIYNPNIDKNNLNSCLEIEYQ